MARYFDNIVDRNGNVVVGANILVTTPAGVNASLYSNSALTAPKGNPLTTDVNGEYDFYAAQGTYTLTISGPGITTRAITDVFVPDADAESAFASAENAEASRHAIDNRIYPGTYSAAPSTRPAGTAIQEGDRYFDSDDDNEYIYRSGSWVNFEAAAAASAAAALVSQNAASESETAAASSASDAENAQAAAEAAADAAALTAGIYPDTAAGLAAVASGSYFFVPSADAAESLILYLDNAGVAVEQKRYPASASLLDNYYRSTATRGHYPFITGLDAADAGGDGALLYRLLRGVVDVRIGGLSTTDTYYIERCRRNVGGNWHIVIKRTSDSATVLQYFAALVEPTDTTVAQRVVLPAVVDGAFGEILIRWSEFVTGATHVGLTMALSPDCLTRGKTSPLNSLQLESARTGNILFPLTSGQYASRDETARTFTWPELLITQGNANQSGRYRLAAGSITFDADYQVAFVDFDELATYGTAQIPNTVVKKAVYANETITPLGYLTAPRQYPLAWSPYAGRVDVNPMIRLDEDNSYTDDIVVKVDQASNTVDVYMRANGSEADALTYIHYRLYHHVAADADVWTIDGIWEVTRTANEAFTSVKELVVTQSELLCALQENGAADFMGGRAHGDEVVTATPTLLLDGEAVSLSSGSATWRHVKEVTFLQTSKLYRVGSSLATALADRKLWLTFRDGEMVADQRIEHLASYTLSNGYMAMLPPHRYSTYVAGVSEDNTSSQISGKYSENGRVVPQDVSARQTGSIAADAVQAVPPVTRVKLWGTYGVECEMEVLEASAAILTDVFFIQRNNYAYNKAYIGFIQGYSGNQAVTAATKWQIKTRYRFQSKN